MTSLQTALLKLQKGRPIIVVDDEERENEGDLVMAAEYATPEWINFMIKECRGLVCVPITEDIAARLHLPQMVENNTETHGTNFTVSVDEESVHTGISAMERSITIKKIVQPDSKPEDFRRPGHIFPLVAHKDGLKGRSGHTEAAIELMKQAQLKPAAVICEIINDDGSMARKDDVVKFSEKHSIQIITIHELKENI